MVYFYQLFLNTDDVILKLYTSLYQKAKCTLSGALYQSLNCFQWLRLHRGHNFHYCNSVSFWQLHTLSLWCGL